MAKEKKIDTRDLAYERIASAIMQDSNLTTLRKHKDGLEFHFNDELFAVRVIKKKDALSAGDFRGEFRFNEEEGTFEFVSKTAAKLKAKAE